MVKGDVLLRVPRRLWLVSDNFPDIDAVKLHELEGCGSDMSDRTRDRIKLSAAITLEERKGENSFYHPHLSTLPTLADFSAFHPSFAGQQVLYDFGRLPPITTELGAQSREKATARCFASWKNSPGSIVADLDWDDTKLARFNILTRGYQAGNDRRALVPGSDLLNTSPDPSLNTHWLPTGDAFTLWASTSIDAQAELYDPYCHTCDNSWLLSVWGVYLEDNINRAKNLSVDCAGMTQDKSRSLRDVVVSGLDVSEEGIAFASTNNFTSPRCLKATLQLEQGPLRCSLSRLAWEHCGPNWLGDGASVSVSHGQAPKLPSLRSK